MERKENKFNNKIVVFVTVAIIAVIAGLLIMGNSKSSKIQEQIDLGNKYLEEMNYDEAIVTFMAVIEIEPKSAEAYLGLVEIYIRTGDFDTALEYAQKGYDMTGDNRLKEKKEMIESRNIVDSNGREISHAFYDENEKLYSYMVYEYEEHDNHWRTKKVYLYSEKGSLLDEVMIEYDAAGNEIKGYSNTGICPNVLHKTEKKYDENGRNIEFVIFFPDSIVREEKDYDNDGNLISQTNYQDGNYRDKTEYQYDEEGNKIKQINYSCYYEGIASYTVYEYDSNGKCTKHLSYDGDGNSMGYSELKYDSDGNITLLQSYDASGVLRQSIEYTKDGQRIEKYYDSNGKLEGKDVM